MGNMHRLVPLFCVMIMAAIITVLGSAGISHEDAPVIIGAITDNSSRIGKEQRVALKMALDDFFQYTNWSFVLHIRDSHGDPHHAALAARELIEKEKAQAIIGPQTWEQTSSVIDICNENNTPLLSLANAIPSWATKKWEFLLQASHSQFSHMKAVAAIVESWEWYQVNIIYEDTPSLSSGVLLHLSTALREANIGINNLVPVPPFVSSSLYEELQRLREGQCRVFVVHVSFPLAIQLFEAAQTLKMMEKEYVWIVTDPFTSVVHSLNASTLALMQGIIGVRSYFSQGGHRYEDFYFRFRHKYSSEHPMEFDNEPGVFAAQAYDAAWTLALAMGENNNTGSQILLDNILLNNFSGLSGKIQFTNHRLSPANTFQIINVMRKKYVELGFWSEGQNFSRTIGLNAAYNSSAKVLGPVFWPGGLWDAPRGWILPTIDKPLRIGVPSRSSVKQFVNIVQDDSNFTSFCGFSIDLFKATVELLPYNLLYQFYAFNDSYDNLVKQIYYKNFDAVVGDVTIVSDRYKYVDFTQPYTDPGISMIVPIKEKGGQRAWLFMKPFIKTMWVLIVVMVIYNGFVLWMLERNYRPELKDSVLNQTGTMCWVSCTTLISLHGDRLHSNLSRMTMLVWLFVALIITQTYTANLASMLTVEKLEPTVDNVDQLRNSNAIIGHENSLFMKKYLHDVLHFHPSNTRPFNSAEEYGEALRSKQIAAVFLEAPVAKLLLAKYCNEFIHVGPTYKIGGYAFAFPRKSPLLPTVNRALIQAIENGKLLDLENEMLASQQCEDTDLDEENISLSPTSFWVLFTLTGGTSTMALLLYMFRKDDLNSGQRRLWRLMVAAVQLWGTPRRQFLRRVSDVAESPMSSPNTPTLPTHV